MEHRYKVRANGRVYGPFERGRLESDAITGMLQPTMDVAEDDGPWMPAGEIGWLFTLNAKGQPIQSKPRAGTAPYGLDKSQAAGQRSVNPYLVFAVLLIIAGYLLPWFGFASDNAKDEAAKGIGLSNAVELSGYDLSRMAYAAWDTIGANPELNNAASVVINDSFEQLVYCLLALALLPIIALLALIREMMSARIGRNAVLTKLLLALASAGAIGILVWQTIEISSATSSIASLLNAEGIDLWDILRLVREGLYVVLVGTFLAWTALMINPKARVATVKVTAEGVEYERAEGEQTHD